jgi:hypothetical protein
LGTLTDEQRDTWLTGVKTRVATYVEFLNGQGNAEGAKKIETAFGEVTKLVDAKKYEDADAAVKKAIAELGPLVNRR